jgi:hypothetical protein
MVVVHSLGGRGPARGELAHDAVRAQEVAEAGAAGARGPRVALDDFELVDAVTEAPLGVQGFAALSPSELSVLFVGSETVRRIRAVGLCDTAVAAQTRRSPVARFARPEGELEPPHRASAMFLLATYRGRGYSG